MLADLSAFAKAGDALGYDSIGFTEHHFHIEGFDASRPTRSCSTSTWRCRPSASASANSASCCPRITRFARRRGHRDARPYVGRTRAGRLCARLSAPLGRHPRAADFTASTARGPVSTTRSTPRTAPAFEEHFNIIRKCWTEDMIEYKGDAWQIPPDGTPWDIEATRLYGAGLDDDNIVRQVGVVPKPLQSRTRRSSSPSPRPSARSAGAPARASSPSCRRCTPKCRTASTEVYQEEAAGRRARAETG